MIIDAVSRRTGKTVASLHIEHGKASTHLEDRIVDGFDGPFFNVVWNVANNLLIDKFGERHPTVGAAFKSGAITDEEVVKRLPAAYAGFNFLPR